jgi:urea transport system ATP-binding protein
MSQKPFLLAAEGLHKSFDGYKAINDLNFYLDEGELRTVIGPNGAGKTTFLDLITGRTQPDEGTLRWDDAKHDLLKLNEYEIYRLGIGRKFQTPTVYNDHTVTENLILSLAGSRGIWHSLFGKTTSEQSDRVAEILHTIKLPTQAHRKAGTLAHGQKQWLEIGMLLAQEARLSVSG